MNKILNIFLISFAVTSSAQNGFRIEGVVSSVIDGNTFTVLADESVYTIVLADVDCPEMGQNFGPEAKGYLEKLILEKKVVVEIRGKNRFKNYIGLVVSAPDVRRALLAEGLCWTSEKNPDADLEVIRLEAKASRKGLWSNDSPVPPWIYRREQSMVVPKSR